MSKTVVRMGVFETNSSSTHSLTILDKSEYDRWSKDKNLYLDEDNETILTREEVIAILKEDKYCKNVNWDDEDEVDDTIRDNQYFTFRQWQDQDEYDSYDRTYTTKSGDEIIVFGSYGSSY